MPAHYKQASGLSYFGIPAPGRPGHAGYNRDLWGCRVERSALGLRVHETPELRSPTLIAAFSGWNDAREVATQAVQFLVRSWSAVRCAELDPEEYFVFSEQRPTVHIV